jgi:hypothetical protein
VAGRDIAIFNRDGSFIGVLPGIAPALSAFTGCPVEK